jgi:hypothetical protein
MTTLDVPDRTGATRTGPPLRLLRRARLADLVPGRGADVGGGSDVGTRRFEASGVALHDGLLWIVCDNLPHLLAVDPSLEPGRRGTRWVRRPGPAPGYEDLARDDAVGRWFLLIEGAPCATGFQPRLDEVDDDGRLHARRWVDLRLHRRNKGLEGLACVIRSGRSHLIALSEGNGGFGGRRGRRPGGGLLHVLDRQGDEWTLAHRIPLPDDLPFTDFSGVSVRGERLAVVSQESAAVWIGDLAPGRWAVADGGRIHPFPTDHRGRTVYGTVEGVCWLDDTTLAVVCDRAKRRHPRRFRSTAESIHVFTLPDDA